MRRKWRGLLLILIGLLFLNGNQIYAEEHYVFIASGDNPYMQTIFEGVQKGCGELEVSCEMQTKNSVGVKSMVEIIWKCVEDGADGIIYQGDYEDISPVFPLLEETGVPFLLVGGSDVLPKDTVYLRNKHIGLLGRALVQFSIQHMGGEGDAALIVQTEGYLKSETIEEMKNELIEHPEVYGEFDIVEVIFGSDQPEYIKEQTKRLLETYPDLKMIICTGTVASFAAAQVIEQEGSEVTVTGFGLPSEMTPYVLNGICPQMFGWNPRNIGYLAAYAVYCMAEGTYREEERTIFKAGELGEQLIERFADETFRISYGDVMKLNKSNIQVWNHTF